MQSSRAASVVRLWSIAGSFASRSRPTGARTSSRLHAGFPTLPQFLRSAPATPFECCAHLGPRPRMTWCSHMSSPSLAPPQASGRYDGGLVDSIPPCSTKTVEAGPHIPSYLYMASKQECVSPGIAHFWHRAIVALGGCAPVKGTRRTLSRMSGL